MTRFKHDLILRIIKIVDAVLNNKEIVDELETIISQFKI